VVGNHVQEPRKTQKVPSIDSMKMGLEDGRMDSDKDKKTDDGDE